MTKAPTMTPQEAAELAEMAEAERREFEQLTQAMKSVVDDLFEKEKAASATKLETMRARRRPDDIEEIMPGPRPEPKTQKMVFLDMIREDIQWYENELLDAFGKIQDDAVKFDIIHFTSRLVEEAFSLASKSGLTGQHLEEAKRHLQSRAALGRVKQIRARGEPWREFCLASARKSREANPGISKEDIVSRMLERWPTEQEFKPVRGTLAGYIRELEENNLILRRQKSDPAGSQSD